MTVIVTRLRMAQLVDSAMRRTYSGRPLTLLTRERVMEAMPSGTTAHLAGTCSGGDGDYVCTMWDIPGVGPARPLLIPRATLRALPETTEPWEWPTAEPEPEQLGLFG